jgi:hypothetical protein
MGGCPYVSSIRVGQWALRKLFNEQRIAERGESGELIVKVTAQRPVSFNKVKNWIPGTLSQELKYYDGQGNLIAKAHRYLRPDGELAASGLIDPKRVVVNNVMHILDESIVEPRPRESPS